MKDVVKKVVQIIESDLSAVPSLEHIAKELGTSRFFLSRAFKDELGESFSEYVKRRKLSEAAREINLTNRKILDIALDFGYGSEEAFSRSFKSLFSEPPRRASFHHGQLFKKSALEITPLIEVEVELKDFQAQGLRAIGRKFSYEQFDRIYEFWRDFHIHCPHITGSTYGISLPLAQNEPGYFYYLIAFSEQFELEQSFKVEIPLRKYAFFKHEGPAMDLMKTFNFIWGKWIHSNPDLQIVGPDFELYPEGYDPMNNDGHCYIAIPLK
jgi:AraC family transcriptional regulator